MKQIITLLAVLSFCVCYGQWSKTFAHSDDYEGLSAQETTDGGYIILAQLKPDSIVLIKTDVNGNLLWEKFLSLGSITSHSLKQTVDGGYIIASTQQNLTTAISDAYFTKTDSFGNIVWIKYLTSPNESFSISSINLTSDGGYVVAGDVYETGIGYSMLFIKLNSQGEIDCWRYFKDTYSAKGFDAKETSGGDFIITGYNRMPNSNGGISERIWLIKVDPQCYEYWDRNITSTYTSPYSITAYDVEQTSDGGYFVLAETVDDPLTSNSIMLYKTNSGGTVTNSNTIKSVINPSSSYYYSGTAQQTSDGGYIVAGTLHDSLTWSWQLWIIKTDPNFNLEWEKIYIADNNEDSEANSIQQTSDGGYIIAGYKDNSYPKDKEVWLLKTDANGDTINTASVPIHNKNALYKNYPNPFSTSTTIELPSEPHILSIYDIVGNKVRVAQVSGTTVIERGDLTKGIYILEVRSENQTYTVKLVVE